MCYNIKYNAIYMAGSGQPDKDPSQQGFNTYQQALLYITSRACKSCRWQAHNGGFHSSQLSHYNGEDYWIESYDILSTSCGAEWIIEEIHPQVQLLQKALKIAANRFAEILESQFPRVCPNQQDLEYTNVDCQKRCQLYKSKYKDHAKHIQKIKECWYWYFYHKAK